MRIVITGGPSVGKTTIISMLESAGYPVVNEMATQIIKEGKFLPWVDRSSFQAEVLRRQLEAEAKVLDEEGVVFLDRGLFDGEAYYIHDKIEIPEAFSRFSGDRYTVALLIEELPFFEVNEVRRENIEFARQISQILETCYTSRGVKVVRIPAMPAPERLEFVLKAVNELANQFVTKISVMENWDTLPPTNTRQSGRSKAHKQVIPIHANVLASNK